MSGSTNGQESGRVRHVPIQVESRSGRPATRYQQQQQANEQMHRQYQDGQQAGRQCNEDNHHQRSHHNFYDDDMNVRQKSPNVSSININYKPPTAPYRQESQPQSSQSATNSNQTTAGQERSNNGSYRNSDNNNSYDSCETKTEQPNTQQRKQRDPSRNRSPNLDKLVNSPEPIPLPPPDQSNKPESNQNNDSPKTQDHQQHPQQQQHQQQNQQQSTVSQQSVKKSQPSALEIVNNIKSQLTNLLPEIAKFDGLSAKSKEYRYLDEMLTRCILSLDQIECGESSELRQCRKSAIKLVDQATDILQRKLQINSDINDLSESMATSP